jgi:diguanylate cyclase (GGDEF)-like protein
MTPATIYSSCCSITFFLRRTWGSQLDEMVLVADDDRDIVRFVEVNLRLEGFEVITAHDGQDALIKALDLQPNLILLDVMMPRMDGYELCTRLRADSRTAHTPVIMLTAKSLSADKVLGLTTGADDYIIKPFDPMELITRVKTTLHRHNEVRALSPLTGLAGNIQIEREIRGRLDRVLPTAFVHADLDYFKSYSDRYGFIRGNEVILLFAQVLQRAAQDAAGPEGFVGHIGGDDFVALVPPEAAESFASRVITSFDDHIPSLYDPEDARAGSIEAEDREGQLRRFPIVSVSLGITSNLARRFSNHREVVTTMRSHLDVAKRLKGSCYAGDLASRS